MDLDGLKRAAEESAASAEGPVSSAGDSAPPSGGSDLPTGGPADDIEPLCYAGESVVEAVPFSGGTVGVTSHRVLALTPGADGPNLRAVDRPNVASIELSAGGDAGHGARAVRFGVYALALVGASFVVDFGAVEAIDPPSGTGAGGVVQMAVAMTGLLTMVDDALRYAGLLVLLVALLFAALYGYSRDSYLAVDVAGGDAVHVPASPSESAAADRLRIALANPETESVGDVSAAPVEKA